jgi:pyruvate,water dikinase
LFAVLFPPTIVGWVRAAERYGWPITSTRFAAVNGWLYYSPGTTDWDALVALEPVAERTLQTAAWLDEVGRWRDVERPPVLTKNLELQHEDLGALDEAGLADHVARAIAHFVEVAPLHFEHSGFDIAAGRLFQATTSWGIDAVDVAPLLAGASPATAAVTAQVDEIAGRLDRVPDSLDDVRAAGQEAARALDTFLVQHGWRVIDGNDLAGPTLAERPGLVLAAIRARMGRRAVATTADRVAVRHRVPPDDRARFDALLADARALYGLRDEDNGLCFVWPLGLIRRGLLEVGRRLVARGALTDVDDLFEATPEEIDALLRGTGGPTAADLSGRRAFRLAARDLDPPMQLGDHEPEPPVELPPHMAELSAIRNAYFAATGKRSSGAMHGLGIGTRAVRGPARVLDRDDVIDRIELGDVLIAITTTPNLNSIFPLLAGVATEEGGMFSHTALLARELGIPAVVGAPGLMTAVNDGDLVEIDPTGGAVRVIKRH